MKSDSKINLEGGPKPKETDYLYVYIDKLSKNLAETWKILR